MLLWVDAVDKGVGTAILRDAIGTKFVATLSADCPTRTLSLLVGGQVTVAADARLGLRAGDTIILEAALHELRCR